MTNMLAQEKTRKKDNKTKVRITWKVDGHKIQAEGTKEDSVAKCVALLIKNLNKTKRSTKNSQTMPAQEQVTEWVLTKKDHEHSVPEGARHFCGSRIHYQKMKKMLEIARNEIVTKYGGQFKIVKKLSSNNKALKPTNVWIYEPTTTTQ